ncbi:MULTISPECIES: PH domain-containing protein [Halorussus]|uniref:PH domain-containing protein n=1 Tax=Halorussus TaxID=1070314 RepID=UPI000E21A7E0|nr:MULTISPECIES: PH domain-containing protein [Halorussus]NHN58461.1 PH domain-containing protein [Halorussus sp. JP-T4]
MRLHPFSVPLRAASRGLSIGLMLFFLGQSLSGTDFLPFPLAGPVLVALAALGVLAAALWQVAYYRRFEYDLTDDGLEIASGVVSRRHREIPLGRVQNVDISRNVIQRALGVAALDVETAGGGATEASLRYVGYDEAKRLQREIQRLKRDGAEADADGEPREEAEELLFELRTEELALLSVLSFDFRYLSLLAFGPAAFPFLPGFAEVAVVGGVLLVALLLGALWVISAAVTFARYYGFRLARVDDELRYERGLLQRYDGSIPLSKVQTLTLEANVLMRRFGYATLAVETAGYGPGQAPSQGSEAAVPLATRERVLRLAREVEEFDLPAFERPPKRARTRYAFRYALALLGLAGALYVLELVVAPPAPVPLAAIPLALLVVAPVAAHLAWRNRGYATGEDHAFTRNGFWNRTTKVVPYYRVQTVIQSQTVFQRRRRLASVVVDTASSAGGAAAAMDLDAADAERLRESVAERLQASIVDSPPRRAAASDSDRDATADDDSAVDADPDAEPDADSDSNSDSDADRDSPRRD